MDLLIVFIMSVLSVTILFFLTKLIGNKQLSQLNMFDYITGITIGSIAAEMATSLEDFMKPLLAMIVYAVLAFLISMLTAKSLGARKFFTGRALILYEDGKLYDKNIIKAKLDTNEFLMLLRNNGYFNLSDLQTVILESNGKLSVLPKAIKRPATPEDLSLCPTEDFPLINVVIDGKALPKNLRYAGKNEIWLTDALRSQGLELQNVALATLDDSGNLSAYQKINRDNMKDIFE